MKKLFILSCCLFFLVLSSSAYAAKADKAGDGFYAQANAAISFFTDSSIESNSGNGDIITDTGKSFSGAVGYKMASNRVEAEIGYSTTEADQFNNATSSWDATGDFSMLNCLVNFYYDFDTGTTLAPYVGAGIGFSRVEVDEYSSTFAPATIISDDDIVFAWQLMTGVSVPVYKNISVDGSLKLFSTADPNFQDIKAGIFAYSLGIGLRYTF